MLLRLHSIKPAASLYEANTFVSPVIITVTFKAFLDLEAIACRISCGFRLASGS